MQKSDAIASPAQMSGSISRAEELSDQFIALDKFFQANSTAAESQAMQARAVLEELVLNAFYYGGADKTGGVDFKLEMASGVLVGVVTYAGPVFDPTILAAKERIEPNRIGGRGLDIIQGLSERLTYQNDGTVNRVEFHIAGD